MINKIIIITGILYFVNIEALQIATESIIICAFLTLIITIQNLLSYTLYNSLNSYCMTIETNVVEQLQKKKNNSFFNKETLKSNIQNTIVTPNLWLAIPHFSLEIPSYIYNIIEKVRIYKLGLNYFNFNKSKKKKVYKLKKKKS